MSYRCLLPFTVLKLLRVLLCYLLSTLMHLGNEREKDAAAAGFRDASVAGGGEASHQHVLQRLLQLCCFFSLVVAMWGLAVVFVATRPLLKPFNIGQNETRWDFRVCISVATAPSLVPKIWDFASIFYGPKNWCCRGRFQQLQGKLHCRACWAVCTTQGGNLLA